MKRSRRVLNAYLNTELGRDVTAYGTPEDFNTSNCRNANLSSLRKLILAASPRSARSAKFVQP